jgi:hypothetical protein
MKKVMRNKKVIAMMVTGLVAILLTTSGVIASPPMGAGDPPVESKINYQGQLTDDTGNPLDGTYDMQFLFYDSAVSGSQVGSTITENDVAVTNGLFNVKLDVNQADFDGQGLWLEMIVEGETLSPRQEILPVPYALSLKPGARIGGDSNDDDLIRIIDYGEPSEENALVVLGQTDLQSTGANQRPLTVTNYEGEAIRTHGDLNIYDGDLCVSDDTGRIKSEADSYIFISGTAFIKTVDTDTTRWVCMEDGSVSIRRGDAAGWKYIFIPITVPGVLYGQEVTVEELTIYYKCQDGTKNYITETLLSKQMDADSAAFIVDDETDRTSNTATSYTLTLTENNVLSSDQGILCLYLWLAFADDNNCIRIGGARLRLSHS